MSRIGNYTPQIELISTLGCMKMIVDNEGQTIIYDYGTPNAKESFISHKVLNNKHEQTNTTISTHNNILQ